MTIKLLAHVLRGSALPAGAAGSSAGRSLAFGRWVLEELVMRRWQPIGWRRQRPPPRHAALRADAHGGDTLWSETQPWCHE